MTNLVKFYERLTSMERAGLAVKTCLRGDDTELARLANASPQNLISRPDFVGSMNLLGVIAMDYALVQWATIARSLWLSMAENDDNEPVHALCAWSYCMYRDAFEVLCDEHGLAPEDLIDDQSRLWDLAKQVLGECPPTGEIQKAMARYGIDGEPVTAGTILQGWRGMMSGE